MNLEELDIKLMGEFTIESMLGGIGLPDDTEISDNPSINALQVEAPVWATQIKGFLLSPQVEQGSIQSQFVSSIKDSMMADYSLNKAMSYLYNENDIDILVQQISMLAMHAQFKNVVNIPVG